MVIAICGSSGAVPKVTVLDVLRSHQVAVHEIEVNGFSAVTLLGPGVTEVQILPDLVSRRLVQRLSVKFKVSIERFYHPDQPEH